MKKLLRQWEEFSVMHGFLKKELAMGRPLPENEDEFQWRARTKPTREMFKMQRKFSMDAMSTSEKKRGEKGLPPDEFMFAQRRNRKARMPRRTKPQMAARRRR